MREQTQQLERQILSPYACLASQSKGRLHEEEPCPLRTDFARDRDRIIHSNAFRRLKQKTQVFLSPQGDHYRTRLTHTLEVSQIARTISRLLQLNEDLTEAIALGHDLGHTPFGHAGERAIQQLFSQPFTHAAQSVRVVDRLANSGKGLNLTFEVRNGIACHGSGGVDADTLEGKVVEFSDKIAYINHDIEDAVRAGVIANEDLPYDVLYQLGRNKSARITTLIQSIVLCSTDKPAITMQPTVFKAHQQLRAFMFDNVYKTAPANSEEEKAHHVLGALYQYFTKHPRQLPELYQRVMEQESMDRAVCDYVSSMTDSYAINLYQELHIPKVFPIG